MFLLAPPLVGRRVAHAPRIDRFGLLALLVVALLLRLALATWGPGDFVVRQATAFGPNQPQTDFYHGTGPLVLWYALFQLLPVSDTPLIVVGLAFAALSVPLVTLVVKDLGGSRVAAFAAGALLAIQPILVRFSGDMSRMPHVLLQATLCLWSLAAYRNTPRVRFLVLFVASAVLCASARPEGAMVIGCAGLLLLVVHLDAWQRLRERSFRREVFAVAVAFIVIVLGFVYAGFQEDAIGRHMEVFSDPLWFPFTPVSTPWLDPDYTSFAVMALALAGAVYAVVRRERAALWALACLVALAYLNPDRAMTQGLVICHVRYHGLSLLAFCVLGGFGAAAVAAVVARRWGGRALRAAVAGLAVATVATSVGPMWNVCEPRTIDYEYRFLREAMLRLPARAVIYYPLAGRDDYISSLRYADVVSAITGRGEWRLWPPTEPLDDRPAYFYHAPACFVRAETNPKYREHSLAVHTRCREGLARSKAQPVLQAMLPAVSFGWERFTRTSLPIGFYELETPGRAGVHD